jgi:adhesin/invasin
MVLQVRRAVPRRFRSLCALAIAAAVGLAACDRAPLLAPNGTVIFLNAGSTSVSATGSVEIIAVLLEQGTTSSGTGTGTGSTTTPSAGTPVHNGTLVSFTSTIGRIEPAEARTENGRVTVRFIGDGRSGAATILAYSGGARTELSLNVGAAAAERIQLTATPIGSSGGASTITARVEDASGNPLSGVPVQFSATRGTLSAPNANTDSTGHATVTLTTTVESTVTATAGSKSATATVTPATRSGLSISAPTTVIASAPAQFTFTLSNVAGVRTVLVNWGDGTTQDIGAQSSASHTHTFPDSGPYTVSATAAMTDGTTETPVTSSVSSGAFQVGISASNTNPSPNNQVTFTATVTPNTVNVDHYHWDFGDGTTRDTDGPVASHIYGTGSADSNRTVTVTVVPVIGRSRSNSTSIRVGT